MYYEHVYVFRRASTNSVVRVTDVSEYPNPAVFAEGFNDFEISHSETREVDLHDPRR